MSKEASVHSRGGKRMYKALSMRSDRPLFGKECRVGPDIMENLDTDYYVKLYMELCRGLQLRNWRQVDAKLQKMKCPKDILDTLYHSWVKFKFARAIRPRMSQTYVYILKHCSTLEGQKVYDDCYEQFTEQPYGTTKLFYERRGRDPIYFRLMEYFYNEAPEWILPLDVFPRIDFKKSKMHYSMEPYEWNGDMTKQIHELVFDYVCKLDIDKIFMPRGDLMAKYGSQKYNDGGVVKFDYERPENSFDSSFKYQRFLTQPLTPREVWLPGKAIKQNNAFMMCVHRQILQRDPLYPSLTMEENHDSLVEHLKNGMWKFDISGFGFQYLREILVAANNAIRELYPCSVLEEQSEIFEQILGSVEVEMDDGSVVKPIRGIGLGYYEDLKTIAMNAILSKHYPIQIYGDQGLIEKRGIEFAFELMHYQFIMNYEKLDEGSSEGRLRWGGYIFEKDICLKPRIYTNSIFGAFFARQHWERKASLYSVYKHYPQMYKSIEHRLINMYDRIYGYEFYRGDSSMAFANGGISTKVRQTGYSRLYNIRSYLTPVNPMVYDPIYSTPYKLIETKNVSHKEARIFQKKRRNIFKKNVVSDTMLYDYLNPVLEFNKKDRPVPRALPRWADLNLILYSNMTSGAITCGLKSEEIRDAVLRQHFASDPFRAKATGGYRIQTAWRSERPPSQEWLEASELLMGCEDIDSMYVNRTDLVQNPMLHDDPMYYNTDLFQGIIERTHKRKRSELSISEPDVGHRLMEEIRKDLPSLLKRNKVTDFTAIIASAQQMLENYDKGYTVAESEHGDYGADDDFYADAIDMVDLL